MYTKSMMAFARAMAAMGGEQVESIETMVERSLFGGSPDQVRKHLSANKRTVEQEYELIQEKRSSLSRTQREYVEYLYNKNESEKEGGAE